MLEINNAVNSFMEIQELITNVASISEENSASTQEILSIIEDENSRISQMNQSIEKVNQLSKKLKSLTKAV
jgi:methyl-accepting chemotaxis protein